MRRREATAAVTVGVGEGCEGVFTPSVVAAVVNKDSQGDSDDCCVELEEARTFGDGEAGGG